MSLADLEFPKSICLRLTRRCNAACPFCQAPNTGRAMLTVAEIARIGVVLKRHGLTTIKLSGGEPTTRDDLPQIIEDLGLQTIKPIIITNGISIQDSVLTSLRKVNGELKLSIHHPGSNNDLVLRVPSFSRILTNIRRARRRSIPFSINTVITPKSTGIMLRMVNFAIDQGARKISFIPVVPRGRGEGTSRV